jgi:anti-sigma regulatory factor (Ser/Thr protein kinase)
VIGYVQIEAPNRTVSYFMHYDVASSFDCDASQVARARSWVHEELAERLPTRASSEVVEDAVLVVSELLTNAIRAGCDFVTVGLALRGDSVRLAVSDDAPGVPTLKPAAPHDNAGRGLPIVSTLAQEWGVERPDPGTCRKEVWAVLAFG